MKRDVANKDFHKRIQFFDQFSYSIKGELVLSTSLSKVEGKLYYIDDMGSTKEVDNRISNSWNSIIIKESKEPECFRNYKEMILNNLKDTARTYILASKAYILHELGNPYESLVPLRQAIYKTIQLPSILEEILVYSPIKKDHFQWSFSWKLRVELR